MLLDCTPFSRLSMLRFWEVNYTHGSKSVMQSQSSLYSMDNFWGQPCSPILPPRSRGKLRHWCMHTVMSIQLFRQRLYHESVKVYATMPIGIVGSKSLASLD